jgi:hypothetical protein
LQALDISDCYVVTNEGVISLRSLPLQTIGLSRCHLVTVAAMRELAELPTLVTMNIFGCFHDVLGHIKVCYPASIFH